MLAFVPLVPGFLPGAFGTKTHFIFVTFLLLITLNVAPTLHAADSASESLFPATKVGNDSGPEGTYYELGTIFRATVPGQITHLRVYALASETGNHIARLWRNRDEAPIAGPFTWSYGGVSGWTNLDIPDVTIEANTDYTVSISTGSGGRNYPFILGDLAVAGGNGANLTHPASAGVFTTTTGTRPTQTYQSANYLRDIVFTVATTPPPTNGPVQITEFLAENDSGLQDEDGDFSDWIEIYNPTVAAVPLEGYQLTDGTATWTFPAVSLESQHYLVVFASGKDRTNQPGPLHTNFKLNNAGEYLALKDASNNILSEFAPAFPPQRADISAGHNASGDVVHFLTPTPGSANSLSFAGFVDDLSFSVKRGFFSAPMQVAITTTTPDATIHYTLNGAIPTESSPLYTNALTVTNTTTLRARGFKPDYRPTKVHTDTYIFLADVIQQTPATAQAYGWPPGPINGQILRYGLNPTLLPQYTTAQITGALQQIPSMSIVTDQANLTDAAIGLYVNAAADGWERPVSIELINPDGTPGFQEDCGLRIRGGQSRSGNFPKHSFHVNFRSEYGAPKLKFSLFDKDGAKEFDTFDLRCEHGYAYADPYQYGNEFTALRDVFCRDMWGATGYATTRSRYYHLYLNGQYWGLYQTQERAEESYAATYFGGAKEEYDVIQATGLPQLTIEASNGNFTNWTQLWSGARTVAANPANTNYFALFGRNDDGTANAALPALLDPRELASYMLLHYYCGHSDEPLSVSFNFEKPNNFRAVRRQGLPWPFHFFVHDGESSVRAPEWVDNRANSVNLTSPNRALFAFSNPEWMHEDLLSNPEYRIAFADEAQRLLFNDGAFTAPKSQPRFDSRASQIDQAVIGESIRWGKNATDNQTTWSNKVSEIRALFFPTRTATVIAQLRQRNLFPSINAPVFSQRGGLVAAGFQLVLTATSGGTIFYTLDGSDPRAIGGAVAGTAYTNPIILNSPTLVRVRLRAANGEWSAIDQAAFTTYSPARAADIVVSEFHYHPLDPTPTEVALGYTDESAFEFIELLNISSGTRDLSGVKFTQGVTFDFANASTEARYLSPDARVVIVANSAAFLSRLVPGAAPTIAGSYAGTLKNSGETITLVDSTNGVIKSFAYGDSAPWPKDADGLGRSLVLNNPFTNPNHALASNWRPSGQIHGAPGDADSSPRPANPFGDDDGNGFSNLFEYVTGPSPRLTLTSESFIPLGGSAADYLYFRYPRSLLADGIDLLVESSTDLISWTPNTLLYVSTARTIGTTAIVTYRTVEPTAQLGPAFFVRLKVQQ